jgi:hypothetical protein
MCKYPRCASEDMTKALGYVYCLEKCEISLRTMKLKENLQNNL